MTTSAIIYHYTTIPGLIGIVTHCELWASDCQFLNDGSELSYARDIFFAELQKLGTPRIEEEGYVPPGRSLQNFRMFITCFCEDGDLLSQWRGYGADQGYALGFDTETLQAFNSSETLQALSPNVLIPFCEIIPVQYGIANPTEYFAQELKWASRRSGHPGVAEWHNSERLLPRLACVKHPGFAEERE